MENYTNYSTNKPVNEAEVKETEFKDETVQEDETTVETAFGYVDNCVRLNIRKRPNKETGEVLKVVDVGTLLMINEPEKAKGDWYKVEVEGLEGYGFCMKEFVTIED